MLSSRAVLQRMAVVVFALVIALASMFGGTASAQQQQLAPIPDMYLGSWWHHGAGITISRPDDYPQQGEALVRWRTYTWCEDALTKKMNAPPCDMTIGNFIEDGGLASIALLHPQGQDDRNISGVVTATSDPSGFGGWGDSVEFTMLPGNMLMVDVDGNSTMFCGDNTDLSQYPPSPCGA